MVQSRNKVKYFPNVTLLCLSEYSKAESTESVKAEANVSLNLSLGLMKAWFLQRGWHALIPLSSTLACKLSLKKNAEAASQPLSTHCTLCISIFVPYLYAST